MIFKESHLRGAYLIVLEPHEDDRGFFARTYCEETFLSHNIAFSVAQSNLSSNTRRGTMRGMHYQTAPFEEAKVVQCIRGAIHDVFIDLRVDSPTFKEWRTVKLSAQNRQLLYIPKGFAHGFQTLEDQTDILYLMSTPYHPECAKGIAWNDPEFSIDWPMNSPIMSEQDVSYAPYH